MRLNVVKRLFCHHRDLSYTPINSVIQVKKCEKCYKDISDIKTKLDLVSNVLCFNFFITNTIFIPFIFFSL